MTHETLSTSRNESSQYYPPRREHVAAAEGPTDCGRCGSQPVGTQYYPPRREHVAAAEGLTDCGRCGSQPMGA